MSRNKGKGVGKDDEASRLKNIFSVCKDSLKRGEYASVLSNIDKISFFGANVSRLNSEFVVSLEEILELFNSSKNRQVDLNQVKNLIEECAVECELLSNVLDLPNTKSGKAKNSISESIKHLVQRKKELRNKGLSQEDIESLDPNEAFLGFKNVSLQIVSQMIKGVKEAWASPKKQNDGMLYIEGVPFIIASEKTPKKDRYLSGQLPYTLSQRVNTAILKKIEEVGGFDVSQNTRESALKRLLLNASLLERSPPKAKNFSWQHQDNEWVHGIPNNGQQEALLKFRLDKKDYVLGIEVKEGLVSLRPDIDVKFIGQLDEFLGKRLGGLKGFERSKWRNLDPSQKETVLARIAVLEKCLAPSQMSGVDTTSSEASFDNSAVYITPDRSSSNYFTDDISPIRGDDRGQLPGERPLSNSRKSDNSLLSHADTPSDQVSRVAGNNVVSPDFAKVFLSLDDDPQNDWSRDLIKGYDRDWQVHRKNVIDQIQKEKSFSRSAGLDNASDDSRVSSDVDTTVPEASSPIDDSKNVIFPISGGDRESRFEAVQVDDFGDQILRLVSDKDSLSELSLSEGDGESDALPHSDDRNTPVSSSEGLENVSGHPINDTIVAIKDLSRGTNVVTPDHETPIFKNNAESDSLNLACNRGDDEDDYTPYLQGINIKKELHQPSENDEDELDLLSVYKKPDKNNEADENVGTGLVFGGLQLLNKTLEHPIEDEDVLDLSVHQTSPLASAVTADLSEGVGGSDVSEINRDGQGNNGDVANPNREPGEQQNSDETDEDDDFSMYSLPNNSSNNSIVATHVIEAPQSTVDDNLLEIDGSSIFYTPETDSAEIQEAQELKGENNIDLLSVSQGDGTLGDGKVGEVAQWKLLETKLVEIKQVNLGNLISLRDASSDESIISSDAAPSASPSMPEAQNVKHQSRNVEAEWYDQLDINGGSIFHIAQEVSEEERKILRGNKLKVVKGIYDSNPEQEVRDTLKVIISEVAAVQGLNYEQVSKIIQEARRKGGISNEWKKESDTYLKINEAPSEEEKSFFEMSKKFSKQFQRECEACGILSGREGSNIGLRTAFIADSVAKDFEDKSGDEAVILSDQSNKEKLRLIRNKRHSMLGDRANNSNDGR